MARPFWMLHSKMDPDSIVYECFDAEEGEPTDEYASEMYGGCFLYRYEDNGGELTDPQFVRYIPAEGEAKSLRGGQHG